MTTRVKIYFHSGFEPPPAAPGSPKQPYLGRSILDLNGKPMTSDPAPKGTTVAHVQADSPVHIEIRPPQDPRPADSNSPELCAKELCAERFYTIGSDWTVSVLEVGATPDEIAVIDVQLSNGEAA